MAKKDTKAFITETSFRLFLDKGYNNTSMSDLMKASDLSKGAFYHYFNNKEDLYHEVVDRYFLSYYQAVDWQQVALMTHFEISEMIKGFYKAFIPEILALTPKGMSRYFMMFFEAYEQHEQFRKEVRSFYRKLKKVLTQKFKSAGIKKPTQQAVDMIAKYEGLIFWLSVFPEKNIDDLLD